MAPSEILQKAISVGLLLELVACGGISAASRDTDFSAETMEGGAAGDHAVADETAGSGMVERGGSMSARESAFQDAGSLGADSQQETASEPNQTDAATDGVANGHNVICPGLLEVIEADPEATYRVAVRSRGLQYTEDVAQAVEEVGGTIVTGDGLGGFGVGALLSGEAILALARHPAVHQILDAELCPDSIPPAT